MKTSDNDLKVNRNIYPDAVNVLGYDLGPIRRILTHKLHLDIFFG